MVNICKSFALRRKDPQETEISRDPRAGLQSSNLSLFFAMLHIMGTGRQVTIWKAMTFKYRYITY